MSYATVYGQIISRNYQTRTTIHEICHLQDNNSLTDILEWLKQVNIKRLEDIPSSKTIQECRNIEFETGISWIVHDNFWAIEFSSSQQHHTDFQKGIPKYFELFQKLMVRSFKPEHEKILKELEQLKVEINRIIIGLREEI